MRRIVPAIVVCVALSACTGSPAPTRTSSSSPTGSQSPASTNRLRDLHSVNELKAAFNQYAGSPRLVLLLSPT